MQWDDGDCFHDHDECYQRDDGADYRGTVSTTKGGLKCQAWSSQEPQQHVKTHAKYPRAGLGGHNFCRNPDGEERPWCYTVDEAVRWDFCDVGTPSELACYSPPPPSPSPPSPKTPPPPPPSPPPPPPPPVPCPEDCAALGNDKKCDLQCNITTCLWDHGDCRDILTAVLGKAGYKKLDTEVIGELVASQGGYMQQAMYGGLLLGLVGGLVATIVLCYLRRKRKKMQLTNRKYTPYGETEDGITPDLDPSGPDSAEVIGDEKR